jgi:hypothetical protein
MPEIAPGVRVEVAVVAIDEITTVSGGDDLIERPRVRIELRKEPQGLAHREEFLERGSDLRATVQ